MRGRGTRRRPLRADLRGETDLADLGARIAAAAGDGASVATRSLPLAAEGLTPMQASRALRHALACFTRDGPEALDQAGFADGLSGFVTEAYARAVWLRRAIAERRFRLAFQPSSRSPTAPRTITRRCCGRNRMPRRRCSGVQEFVTFAETAGCPRSWTGRCWHRLRRGAPGPADPHRRQPLRPHLQSPAFRERLLALLDAEPLLTHRLLIEITETAEIEDEAEAVRTVEALRERGLPLCIDDFGAGAAAFRYLRAFRVDYVKIDGLYVAAALRSDQDRGIVAGMVDLARTVGARVVAERIETRRRPR